jgi:opacity protein-like surface antigen
VLIFPSPIHYTNHLGITYMKKLLIATTVAAALFSPQAFAQANNFQGFSVAFGVNLTNSDSTVSGATIPTITQADGNADVQAQYSLALGDKFVIGLGASTAIADYKLAANANMKNSTSFFITPGYAVSDTLLVYGKLASLSGKFTVDVANLGSADMTGTGYGVGVKSKMNKNLFAQGEVVLNQYDDKRTPLSSFKHKSTFVSIGIGYQF